MAGGVSSPVIISVTVAAVLVLSVALITIVRWARTKPSRELPPPRPASLSPYWAKQQRYSQHLRGGSDFYDEERKLTAHGSGVFKPFGEYAASNASDVSLNRGAKTPFTDGDRSPNNSAFNDNLAGSPSTTPQLQPTELGEVSLNSPNPPRQRPSSIQFVDGQPLVRPAGSSGSLPPNGLTFPATGGDPQQAAATDPQHATSHPPPPSSFHGHHPSPPRPVSTMSRSRHSFAGPSQPPPTMQSIKQDRRASRMSLYSTYSSSHYHDPRRSSVGSFRGPPHKTNMQIILPQPLAPVAGTGNNNVSNGSFEAEESLRRSRRHSRVDLWTETNNVGRTLHGSTADNTIGSANRRNRRPSQGSERSSRSLEMARAGQQQFMHMEPPPPLPAASSSFLSSSRSATPTSSFSALPTSSAATTPRTGSSSQLSHDKADGTVEDDGKKPRNDVLENQIPSVPPIEPTKDN